MPSARRVWPDAASSPVMLLAAMIRQNTPKRGYNRVNAAVETGRLPSRIRSCPSASAAALVGSLQQADGVGQLEVLVLLAGRRTDGQHCRLGHQRVFRLEVM